MLTDPGKFKQFGSSSFVTLYEIWPKFDEIFKK
jgi:hypothetical protein